MKKTKDWFKNNYNPKSIYSGILVTWLYSCIIFYSSVFWNVLIKEKGSLTDVINTSLYINYCVLSTLGITILFIMFFTLPMWIMHILMFDIPEKRRLKEKQELKDKKLKEDIIQRDILRHANRRTNFTNH